MPAILTHKPSCECEKCRPDFGRLDENVSLRPDITEIFKLYSEDKFTVAKESIEYALLNAWAKILYHVPEGDMRVFTAADKLTELWHELNLRLPRANELIDKENLS